MPTLPNNPIDWLLGFVDGLAARWTRARHLQYRRRVRAAAARGDELFLRRQVESNQLTTRDLRRIRKRHVPASQWPDQPEDLFGPAPGPAPEPQVTTRR